MQKQILAAIDAQMDRLNSSPSPSRIADARAAVLDRLRDALSGGFPLREAYEQLSLVPYIFQEANYDGIDWVQRGADLAQLTPLFEIDACIWSGGWRGQSLRAMTVIRVVSAKDSLPIL